MPNADVAIEVSTKWIVGVVLDFLIAGIVYPVKKADRPQPAAEPGVQGILITGELRCIYILISLHSPCPCESILFIEGNHKLLLLSGIGGKEPGGYPVSPPELTAYAPVLDIFQPVTVCRNIFCRMELNLSFQNRRQGYVCKMLHPKEPLPAQTGLYGGILIPLRIAHLVVVISPPFVLLYSFGLSHSPWSFYVCKSLN